MYTFIDLFAGIGGMRLAYEQNGCKCVFSSEIDKFCQQTYFANFGETPYGDISTIPAKEIPDHDILVAGFPCQPFSVAGIATRQHLGKETGFEDKTQGTLFFEICRILKYKRPKAFMLENVKNLQSHNKGNTFKIIQEVLDELNYAIFFAVLDGKDYVPQHRERIFIVGFDKLRYKNMIPFTFDLTPTIPQPTFKTILETEVEDKYTLSDKLWTWMQNHAAKHQALGHGFGFYITPLDGIAHTLPARYGKDGSNILIAQENKNPRKLTPRECARLQGFPDTFKIVVSNTQAYKQFGNSVVVPLISNIAKLIITTLNALETKEE